MNPAIRAEVVQLWTWRKGQPTTRRRKARGLDIPLRERRTHRPRSHAANQISSIEVIMLPNLQSCIVIDPSSSIDKPMMKLGGFLLLLSGWGIVLAALFMLHGGAVSAFVFAGLAVEILGLVLVFRAHLPVEADE